MGRKIGKILIVLGMIFLLNVLGSRLKKRCRYIRFIVKSQMGKKDITQNQSK